MEFNSCPHCGTHKHPLNRCPRCGFSALSQQDRERKKELFSLTANSQPKQPKGLGYLGRNRVPPNPGNEGLQTDRWTPSTIELDEHFSLDRLDYDPTPRPISTPRISYRPSRNPANRLRASALRKALPWLTKSKTPLLPVQKTDRSLVYDGWRCEETHALALELIQHTPDFTFRQLQEALTNQEATRFADPYLWWVWLGRRRETVLYLDTRGLPFIRMDKQWYLAYPLRDIRGLVGARSDYTDHVQYIPMKGYFICWESEDMARNYLEYQKLSKQGDQENAG